MNSVIMMGRLTADPTLAYGGANNTAVSRFNFAVDRDRKVNGNTVTDFFRVVSFGSQAEFVEKYLRKGMKVLIRGEVQTDNYERGGQMQYSVNIVTDKIEFCESKGSNGEQLKSEDGFMNIPENIEGELPFN